MPDDSSNNVLFRMAGIDLAADKSAAENPAPGLDRALAESVVRVAAAVPGLSLGVKGYETARKEREVALSASPTPGTILPLRSNNGDFAGTLIFDASMSDALVEAQTLGRVEREARPARMPTKIDAALCRVFGTKLLADVSGRPGVQPLNDLHPSRHLSLSSELELVVSSPSLIVVELNVSFASSERLGKITLLLPDRPRAALPAPEEGRSGRKKRQPSTDPREPLLRAKARLEATLPTVKMTLGALLDLKPGDLVQLPHDAVGSIALSGIRLGGGNAKRLGDQVVMGRLGQKDGNRAIKIRTAQSADTTEPPTDDPGPAGDLLPPPSVMEDPVVDPGLDETKADLPDMPDLPDLPATADDLPALSDLGGDLPDLPDLDDMAGDLPDLPDLEATNP